MIQNRSLGSQSPERQNRIIRPSNPGVSPEDLDPKRAVASWKIEAIGDRPIDYMARDFLIAAFQRDRRLQMFHNICKDRPEWMRDHVNGLSPNKRWSAHNLTAIQFCYRTRWKALIERADSEIRKVLERLWKCPPYGALMAWQGQRSRDVYRTCDLARVCPWCLARQAIRLFQRIQRGPLQNPDSKLLIRIRLSLSDEDLCSLESRIESAEQIRTVRSLFSKLLVQHAKRLGIEGGVFCYQVGPQRYSRIDWAEHEVVSPNDSDGFEYRLHILGSIDISQSEQLSEVLQNTEHSLNVDGGIIPLQVVGRRASEPNALRHLLIGTSFRYTYETEHVRGPGAIWHPSWPIASYQQFREYYRQTRGMRLFSPFGTWKGALRD